MKDTWLNRYEIKAYETWLDTNEIKPYEKEIETYEIKAKETKRATNKQQTRAQIFFLFTMPTRNSHSVCGEIVPDLF